MEAVVTSVRSGCMLKIDVGRSEVLVIARKVDQKALTISVFATSITSSQCEL